MARSLIYYLLSGGGARVVALLVVPLYIRYLGIEAYGLIGFYLLLLSSAQLVELGVGTSVARRVAQLRSREAPAEVIRRLAIRVGSRYGLVVAALALLVFGPLRPLLVQYVEAESLSAGAISYAIALMGGAVTAHLALNYLTNLLLGLEQHLTVSGLRFAQVGALQLMGVGVVLLVPDIGAYFLWQLIGAWLLVLFALLLATRAYRRLPKGDPGAEEIPTLERDVTAGVAGVTLLGFAFSQVDRIALSGAVPLSEFGYYSLAFSVVNAVNVLVAPTFSILLPAISRRAERGVAAVWDLYRDAHWVTLALLLPAIATLVFLPATALWAWTGDRELAMLCAPLVQLLAVGALAQGLTNPPWLVQLGMGRTGAEVLFHLVLVVLTPLAVLAAVDYWSLSGAALAVASAHVLHLLVSASYVDLRFFRRLPLVSGPGLTAWLLVLPPALGAWIAATDMGRFSSAGLVMVSYGLPAFVGLVWAMRRLHRAGTVEVETPGRADA